MMTEPLVCLNRDKPMTTQPRPDASFGQVMLRKPGINISPKQSLRRFNLQSRDSSSVSRCIAASHSTDA